MDSQDKLFELNKKLKEIDQAIPNRTPSDFQIEEIILKAKIRKQKIFYFELLTFFFIAILTLATLLSVSIVMPIVIIASQILAISVIPTVFLIYKKTNKAGERLVK
ncbi:MAG: hypothetical protein K0S34_53 [Bacillales bacterium]|jgi:hypothetical protein|nr:hypothetical protein [Bacillales bacterium]